MSGLLSILHNAGVSLLAQQAYSTTVAHNLSNANTPGYARQRAELAAVAPAQRYGNSYLGRGAMLQGVTQARDRFLEAQLPDSLSRERMSFTEAQMLESINALDIDTGVGPALGSFYGQLRALSQNPGSRHYREAAVGSATQLALAFNRTAQGLDSARSGIDARIEARVPEVNEMLRQVANLNAQVHQARASGGEPNDLLDARQKLGDQLAQALGATQVPNQAGDLNLVLANGTSLVAGERAASLSTLPNPTNDGHLDLRLTLPDGTGPKVLQSIPGGEMGGLLTARDTAIKAAEQSIDQMAFELSSAMNALHQGGFGLDGSTGRDFFQTSATASGAAAALRVNADITADVGRFAASSSLSTIPGDASNLQALIDTESLTLSSGTNAAGTLARVTASFGAAAQKAMAVNEGDRAQLTHLSAMRESVSGVSVDEELINMTKAQRGYEAVAKVIQTADAMLETLLSLK
jgi:flagellar hook-associated protein 1 FlgK